MGLLGGAGEEWSSIQKTFNGSEKTWEKLFSKCKDSN